MEAQRDPDVCPPSLEEICRSKIAECNSGPPLYDVTGREEPKSVTFTEIPSEDDLVNQISLEVSNETGANEEVAPEEDLKDYQNQLSIERYMDVLPCRRTLSEVAGDKRGTQDLVFTKWTVMFITFSMTSYSADIGTDIVAAYTYYKRGDRWWAIMTLTLIAVPLAVITTFSLKWYVQDRKRTRTSACRWTVRGILLTLQLGLILRYVDTLVYGVRSWYHKGTKQAALLRKMLLQHNDASLLNLIESFTESAPQLCLQLYIMTRTGLKDRLFLVTVQTAACVTSLVSIAWSLAGYHRSLRLAHPDEAKIPYCGSAVQFFWRLCTVGCRVMALVMFASQFRYWVFLLIGVHWLLMFLWINRCLKSNFCPSKLTECIFQLVLAAVYIFEFLNIKEGHTRLRYLCYYSLMFLENSGMIIAWYLMTQAQTLPYRFPVFVTFFAVTVGGIMFFTLYYLKYHPRNYLEDKNKRIKVVRSWSELKPSKRNGSQDSTKDN